MLFELIIKPDGGTEEDEVFWATALNICIAQMAEPKKTKSS